MSFILHMYSITAIYFRHSHVLYAPVNITWKSVNTLQIKDDINFSCLFISVSTPFEGIYGMVGVYLQIF